MATYTVGGAAEVLGVSPDTVRRWIDAGRLGAERVGTGPRQIDGAELARFAESQAHVTTEAHAVSASARNRFPGIVTRVVRDVVMAQVEVQSGPYRVISLISRESADALKLEPGVAVVAAVKATNVIVELSGQH